MAHWKHSINLFIYAIMATWTFLIVKYLRLTGTQACSLTSSQQHMRTSTLIITWVMFGFACFGALMSMLEIVGVIHAELTIF
jgi:hypothetical protein